MSLPAMVSPTADRSLLSDLPVTFPDNFNVTDDNYENGAGEPTLISILSLKNPVLRKQVPVIFFCHGLRTYLFSGDRLDLERGPAWLLELAERHGAIIVAPNYRLLPEATGLEMLADMRAVLRYLQRDLAGILAPMGLTADTNTMLAVGVSAGAWLAVNTALLYRELEPDVGFAAIISGGGMLDLRSDFFNRRYPGQIAETMPGSERGRGGFQPTKGGSWRRHTGALLINSGRLLEHLGTEPDVFPLDNLERARSVAPIWLYHAGLDQLVASEGSRVFAERAQQACNGDVLVKLSVVPMKLDGFEMRLRRGEREWLSDGLDWVEMFWPALRD